MINWNRIFKGDAENLNHEKTLMAVRKVIVSIGREDGWTDTLDAVFDSILWEQETPKEFANRIEENEDAATRMHDHGYRALRTMAEKGLIKPTWL